jgi:hypothetical protein
MEHGEMLNIFIVTLILILLLSSTLTNSWTVVSSPAGEIDGGLWKICANVTKPMPVPGPNASKQRDMYPLSKGFTCLSIDDGPSLPQHLNIVRGLSIAGTVFVLISLILYIAMPENVNIFMSLLMLGGILSIAATIFWATDKDLKADDGAHYGYSWYMGLIGGILANIFALLFHFDVIA